MKIAATRTHSALGVVMACVLTAMFSAALWSAAGCAGHRERLPTYPPAPADETWQALRKQATGDIVASGEVTLWTDRGRATFDCAIASDSAGNFRMRAWKLDQAALDITLNGGELWVHAPQSEGDLEQLRASDLARAWRLLSGTIFDQPPPPALTTTTICAGTIEYTDADGVRITVDRATRTARRFELTTGDSALVLELDRFELIGDRPWPSRLDLRSGDRRARITLRDIELGAPPPPGAFTPPRRARQLEQP